MKKSIATAIVFCCFVGLEIYSQERYAPESLTAKDYQKAERGLDIHTRPLTWGLTVQPNWINEHQFWYRNTFREGTEYILVDAEKRTRTRVFDHQKLAKALSRITNVEYEPFDLPITNLEISKDQQSILFDYKSRNFKYDVSRDVCESVTMEPDLSYKYFLSPNRKKGAFIRDYNLWVMDVETKVETQLTTDGIQDFGYATNNAGWLKSDRPVLLWSPDSKKIATFQHDSRGVGEMYLVTTNVGHPTLEAWKYPLPGDSLIFRIHRVVIHLEGSKVIRLKMPPDPHRSSITDHVATRGGTFADVEWSTDSESLAFVSSSRDHKEATCRVANIYTGEVRDVVYEKEETFFESGYRMSNWSYFPEHNEMMWFSARSNWGHLYLYDLQSSKLKNQITDGEWLVLQVRHQDRQAKTIYFTGVGREPGDPYFQYLYKVNMDGTGLTLLTPDSASHIINISPDGSYFTDSYSTPVSPPVTVLRDKEGKVLMKLEAGNISRLLATGWKPPTPVKVKARDGETDLYGLMFTPTNLDSTKKYPIINYIYPGPQSGSIRSRSFMPSRRDNQAMADLGFVVVAIDAMGTPMRSKSFHEYYYGNMGDNGLPDQIAGMRQLAQKYTFIDLDRAGIWGHSGGGFASTDAILRYPDFFKVAVSGAGNHDNRNYEDDWGEKWQGLLKVNEDGTTNYDNQANQLLVENLKGKLLLAHGTLDDNVPMYNTLLVADRLIEANKDFDMLLFPNRRHGFATEPYMMRKRWDYFVENLLGAKPPKEYQFNLKPVRP